MTVQDDSDHLRRQRLDVIEQVITCQRCDLYRSGSGPVPFTGPTPAYLAVVGEAPGRREDVDGAPFVGPAGDLLRDALRGAGIDPDTVALMNAVSCWPDRTPNRVEVNACATNLADQLDVVAPRWVCLLGSVALSTLRPDLKISKARGHVFQPPGRGWLAFATFHPAYALRQARGEAIMRDDLCVLAKMCSADKWDVFADDSCVVCGLKTDEMGDHDLCVCFDSMGVSYCNVCYDTRSPDGKADIKAVKKIAKVQEQTGMLFRD